MYQFLFEMRDITDADEVFLTKEGIILRSGCTDTKMVFDGLNEYTDWLDRNADRLPGNSDITRHLANVLSDALKEREQGSKGKD